MLLLTLSGSMVGCGTTQFVAKTPDEQLTSHIPVPTLSGPTWGDISVLAVEMAEVIRQWNCRGEVLREDPPTEECQ